MKKLLLKTMLLLCALVAGSASVWADSYSITFSTGSGDGSQISTSTACSSIVSSGSSYLEGNVETATKVYSSGSYGLKLGASSAAGVIKMNLSSAITPTSITVNAKLYNSSKAATIAVNSKTAQSLTADFADYTFDFDSEISYIQLNSSKYCWVKSITVTYSNSDKADPELSWSSTSASVTYNDEGVYTLPVLTNTNNVDVTYQSTNSDVATIATDGTVTINNVTGSTTIKAVFEGDEYYNAKTASYTLNVTKGAFKITDGVFDFVGAGSEEPLVDYGSGVTLSSGDYVTADKTWTAGNVTMVTKMVSGNGYRWWNNDKTLRFYNECTATFSVPSGYVITKIVTTGADFDSADEGTLSSSTWTGLSNTVTLHATGTRNVKTITVTYMAATYTRPVTADKWGTLCLPYNATVEGATLYTFEGVDNTDAPTVAYFEEAASVEAGKPYFFKATGTTLTATYTSTEAQAASSANGAVGTLTDIDVAEGKYLLSDNKLVKCGTGCTLAANRVYVDMTAVSVYSGGGAVKMGVDLTDGISVVDAQSANATVFDLSGRRVVKPTKGLYIVNGKKVVK